MIFSRILFFVLLLLDLCFFLWFGSAGAGALAAALVLVPLVSLPVNLSLRRRLSVSLEAPVSARKGDPLAVTLRLRNGGLLPALRLRCLVRAENQLNRQSATQEVLLCLPPRGARRSRVLINSTYCGRLRLSVNSLTLYDCFGLIGVRVKKTASCHVTVQPDTFQPAISLRLDPSSADDSESYSDVRPGFDLSETYQIREYVMGDNPRQIHWKLTNKFDKIIVRDPSLPISRNILVFWERTGDGKDPRFTDAQAEVVVSLCRALLDSGSGFTLGWNDTDRNLCVLHPLKDMDDLVAVIPRLLRSAGAVDAAPGAALLTQTRPDALCAHMVYIGCDAQTGLEEMGRYGHVTALLCGDAAPEDAVLFDPWDYPKQLAQIEI